jgi:hypothetical protein
MTPKEPGLGNSINARSPSGHTPFQERLAPLDPRDGLDKYQLAMAFAIAIAIPCRSG